MKTMKTNVITAVCVMCAASALGASSATNQFKEVWKFSADSTLVGTPTFAADGTIYLPSEQALYALGGGGAELWHIQLDPFLQTTRDVMASGRNAALYLVSEFGLTALNLDGTAQWETNAISTSWAAQGDDGTIYTGGQFATSTSDFAGQIGISGSAQGAAAFAPDGTIRWTFAIPDAGARALFFAVGGDGTLYFDASNGKAYALDTTGQEKWEYLLESEPGKISLASDGTILVSSKDGTLYALNPDGTKRWVFKILDSIGEARMGQEPTVYVTGFRNLDQTFKLCALNLTNGIPRWIATVNALVSCSDPAVGANVSSSNQDAAIYLMADTGVFQVFSRTGAQIGSWNEGQLSFAPVPTPVLAGSLVYLAYNDTLHVLSGAPATAALGAWPLEGRDLAHSSATPAILPPPHIVEFGWSPQQGMSIIFQGEAYRMYAIEASSDLRSWTALRDISAGANGLFAFTDPAANVPARFYRAVPLF